MRLLSFRSTCLSKLHELLYVLLLHACVGGMWTGLLTWNINRSVHILAHRVTVHVVDVYLVVTLFDRGCPRLRADPNNRTDCFAANRLVQQLEPLMAARFTFSTFRPLTPLSSFCCVVAFSAKVESATKAMPLNCDSTVLLALQIQGCNFASTLPISK